MAGGGKGGIWRAQRMPAEPWHFGQYGYNQVSLSFHATQCHLACKNEVTKRNRIAQGLLCLCQNLVLLPGYHSALPLYAGLLIV